MTVVVARVQEVLQGHSARAQIRAVDAEGHALSLEVPVEAARGLTADHVVVVTWSAHLVPAPWSAPADEASKASTDTAATSSPSSDGMKAGPSPGARHLASLIGLKLE